MTIGLLFWIVMLFAALSGWFWPRDAAYRGLYGSLFIVWVLLFLLGWAAFGAPIKT